MIAASDVHTDPLLISARETIAIEANAILNLKAKINADFIQACQIILRCKGRVIVTGMGKSGHIGSKIAATLASTGTPSFFVHPGEASHGDLGMLTPNDVVLALSYSGNTQEIATILPRIQQMCIPLISLTGRSTSKLAKASTVFLDIGVKEEACPLGLAPTSSTTAALVMGDALAIALLKQRDFTKEDFALAHPGGHLGQHLTMTVAHTMHQGDAMPLSRPEDRLNRVLIEMNQKRLGLTVVVNEDQKMLGIFTDGDLRRVLDQGIDIHATLVKDVMTHHAVTCSACMLAKSALDTMKKNRITALVVTNIEGQPIGVAHLHDLLQLERP